MTNVISDRPARNGPWAAGLAASEEKSGAAETYESNIYQPTDMPFVHSQILRQQEAFITSIDITNGNERELLDNYWMPSISAGGKSAS